MLIRTDTLVPWKQERLNGIAYPRSIEKLWTVEELAAIGLVAKIPFILPAGMRRVGPVTYNPAGQEVVSYEPIPQPTPEEKAERKAQEIERLIEMEDTLSKALFALSGQPNIADYQTWLEELV